MTNLDPLGVAYDTQLVVTKDGQQTYDEPTEVERARIRQLPAAISQSIAMLMLPAKTLQCHNNTMIGPICTISHPTKVPLPLP